MRGVWRSRRSAEAALVLVSAGLGIPTVTGYLEGATIGRGLGPIRPADEPPIARLLVGPPVVEIARPDEHPRLIAIAVDSDGFMRDVTAQAVVHSDLAASVEGVESDLGRLRAGKAGVGPLRVQCREFEHTVQLRVSKDAIGGRLPVRFRDDVVPALTRAGCNAGSCHGSASGKNGFKLSLFGDDPSVDFVALTRGMRGRRLDLAEPEKSLLLQKPTAQIAHKGGQRIGVGDVRYDTLFRWIREGARDDRREHVPVRSLLVWPEQIRVASGEGASVPFVATAVDEKGRRRDVTHLALWSSSDETVAAMDGEGVVVAGDRRGEAVVMARFGGLAAVGRVVGIPRETPVVEIPEPSSAIDAAVQDRLIELRLPPTARCDDSTFLRRACLDLVGQLPTAARVREFLKDDHPEKRVRLVNDLLADPRFGAIQANEWADVLRIESRRLRRKGMHVYVRWLREQFVANRPVDELFRELLTATGSNFDVPAANYWLVETSPRVLAENTAQALLGVRMQCAQCHNHPFDRWTMDDYYGFAAFFGRVTRKSGEDPRERIVIDEDRGEVRNRRSRQNAVPRLLGGEEPEIKDATARRRVLADWLVSADNPWFSKHVANRMWAHFFGEGLVAPVDDVRTSNPPVNAVLLDVLAGILRDEGFDLRSLARAIVLSATYQRKATPDAYAARVGAGFAPQRSSAETLSDAIDRVTGVEPDHRDTRRGASSLFVPGERGGDFLELFGRPRRETVCACERRVEPTLNQVLHLINGSTISRKLSARSGMVEEAARADPARDSANLDRLFLTAFARFPDEAERERFLGVLEEVGEDRGARRSAWQDVYWAVLNSREFLFKQ